MKRRLVVMTVPVILMLAFVILHPKEHQLRLEAVRVKRVPPSEVIFQRKSVTGVDLRIRHDTPFFIPIFDKQCALFIDPHQGIYLQDDHGIKWGYSSTANDKATWRRFLIRVESLEEGTLDLRCLMLLGGIPESAGRLTLRTTFNLHEEYPSAPLARLPIAVVVRE